jgi:hypothetical protein
MPSAFATMNAVRPRCRNRHAPLALVQALQIANVPCTTRSLSVASVLFRSEMAQISARSRSRSELLSRTRGAYELRIESVVRRITASEFADESTLGSRDEGSMLQPSPGKRGYAKIMQGGPLRGPGFGCSRLSSHKTAYVGLLKNCAVDESGRNAAWQRPPWTSV